MRQTDAVKAIMGKCVSPNSLEKYAGQNSIFLMYCYERNNYHDLLEPWFVDKLDNMHSRSKQQTSEVVI